MAEAILAEIGIKIIEILGSAAFKKFMSVKELKSNIEKLGEIKSIIAAELHKFDPFEVSTDLEGNRIKRLRRIHDDLVHFFEERETKTKQKEVMTTTTKFFSSSNQLVSPIITSGKVNAIMKELKSIASDYVQCSSIVGHSSKNQNSYSFTSSHETSPFPLTDAFIGRDRDKENLVNMTCSSSDVFQVVAIVGVGGQGKTTLAQYVCQDARVKGSFDQQLWVSLTPKSSVNEIFQKMIISATGEEPINSVLEQLHLQVLQAIDGKKCLLVLDNVFYVKDLRDESEALSAILEQGCFWSNGGKVLITSRSKEVAEYMHTLKPLRLYHLPDLAEDVCWMIFQHYAIKHREDKKGCAFEVIGKEIVRMCPKMPLVLKTIGCYLAGTDGISQWERFKNQLASNPTSYIQQQEKIKQILKLCYDQLHYNLKRCAAFCSLFPKGHRYNKTRLMNNWVMLGFVESTDCLSLHDVMDAYVLELTHRAFFEKATCESFRMHDVTHDLMQFIGKDKHRMIDSKSEDIVEGVCHVSLNMDDLNWDVLLSSTSNKQTLESILLFTSSSDNCDHGVRLGSGIDRLIPACPKLKILEISKQDIKKVPNSIGNLIHMKSLNLSWNSFCSLPKEITNLVNLLSLSLSHCGNLKELPQEMGKLVNLLSLNLAECSSLKDLPRDMGALVKLIHLWVTGCELRCMPKGFGNLKKLQTLDMFVVGENSQSSRGSSKAEVGAKLEELGCLENLEGDLCIKLGKESKYIVSEAREALLETKTKLSKLKIVFKKGAEEDQKFLEGIQLLGENLRELSIHNYGGKRMPMCLIDGQLHKRFPKLSVLTLQRYDHEIIPLLYRPTIFNEYNVDDIIRIAFVAEEDDLVEWVPSYSRLKEQLKMRTIQLNFTTRRDTLIPTDLTDQTLYDVYISITEELAPTLGCGVRRQRQPEVLFKSCFPNLTVLRLVNIPELEILPEEFRELSSLKLLTFQGCLKLKALPDWIDSLSSLRRLLISGAPELKVLPDTLGDLTSLRIFLLEEGTGLELLPHHFSNIPMFCCLNIDGCSRALFQKWTNPTSEYRPHLQGIYQLRIKSSEGDEFKHTRLIWKSYQSPESSYSEAEPEPHTLIGEPIHPISLFLRKGLLLLLVIGVVYQILLERLSLGC